MKQQIIIPWRYNGDPQRMQHHIFLKEYYSQEFDIIIGNNEGEFNRSAARNDGVNKSSSEISVLIDADNYIPLHQIWRAIKVAEKREALVKPFRSFGYLSKKSTKNFYESFKNEIPFTPEYINSIHKNFPGGAYVIKKYLWQQIGGMDENFLGWGTEDLAFHLFVKKKAYPIIHIPGFDYHLYHEENRNTCIENIKRLSEHYGPYDAISLNPKRSSDIITSWLQD